jgi:hypothetical protein
MSMGYVPSAVREPTVHDHDSVPAEFAFLSTSPFAVLYPLSYVTVIEQLAPAAVLMLTFAVPPFGTDDVRLTFLIETGFGVGCACSGVASSLGSARGSGPPSPTSTRRFRA